MPTLVSHTPKYADTKPSSIHSSIKSRLTCEGREAYEMSYQYYIFAPQFIRHIFLLDHKKLYQKETGGKREEEGQIKT